MNALLCSPEAKLPTLREFAELLFRDADPKLHAAKRDLLVQYAKLRAVALGEGPWTAAAEAHRIADECTLSAEELEAEYGR